MVLVLVDQPERKPVPTTLHYLDFATYGTFRSSRSPSKYFEKDPHASWHHLHLGDDFFNYLVLDAFRIDLFAPIRILASTNHPKSLHAEFTIAERNTRIACWYKPVVRRLFAMGEPLILSTWLTDELATRLDARKKAEPIDLPKSIVLRP